MNSGRAPLDCNAQWEGRFSLPAAQAIASYLRIAGCWFRAGVGVGAQRPQVGGSVGHTDHGQGACVVLAVERSRLGDIERAAVYVGIIGIVKPETYMEGINWVRIAEIRIKAEDLVQQNRFDGCIDLAFAAGLQIRLVPGES